MTVNYDTGEIVEFDTAAAERRAERITLRLDAIADNYRAVLPMIREAIEKRDDLALGYRSPGDYVSDRFGQSLAGLGIEVRRAVVGELTEAGLSTRAIAPVVGVTHPTVIADRRAGGKDLPPADEAEPDDVVDADLVDDETEVHDRDDVAAEFGIDLAGDEPELETEPRPVTGIDGKTYKRPEPKARPRKPLTDSFRATAYEVTKKVESLGRLVGDDRWNSNRAAVAGRDGSEVLRALIGLAGVTAALDPEALTEGADWWLNSLGQIADTLNDFAETLSEAKKAARANRDDLLDDGPLERATKHIH